MNIAFCLIDYFPFGGLQRKFLRFATACKARGHSVDVYVRTWKGEIPEGIQVHRLSTVGLSNHRRYARFSKKLTQVLAQKNYDIVVGCNKLPNLDLYYAADICYKANAYKKRSRYYRMFPRYKIYQAFEEAVFNNKYATQILIQTKQQKENYQAYYQTPDYRFHPLPVQVLHHDRITTLDRAEISREKRIKFNFSPEDKVILFIGSAFKTKGLLRAMKALGSFAPEARQQIKFLIAGDGKSNFYRLKAYQWGLSKQVHFLGGRADIAELLMMADVLCHPALFDNTGNVITEALVAGTPVITTDTCGYATHVKESGAGIVIDSPFSQAQLNEALHQVLNADLTQQCRWKENAIAYRPNLTKNDLTASVIEIIESLSPDHCHPSLRERSL